jgi:hypothetical protein
MDGVIWVVIGKSHDLFLFLRLLHVVFRYNYIPMAYLAPTIVVEIFYLLQLLYQCGSTTDSPSVVTIPEKEEVALSPPKKSSSSTKI